MASQPGSQTLKTTFKRIFTRQQLKQIQTGLEINLDATPTSLTFKQWLNIFNLFIEAGSEAALRR